MTEKVWGVTIYYFDTNTELFSKYIAGVFVAQELFFR